MPSSYQPRRGGIIEVVSEQAASELVVDLKKRPDSSEYIEPEERYINEYIQQNSKRVESASSTLTADSSASQTPEVENQLPPVNKPPRSARHASAHRLFEVNEWDENQKRIKQKLQANDHQTTSSYQEIKAATRELLQDYEKLIHKAEFENERRREFIYRNYRCNVREPYLLAKFKQFEQLEKTRATRDRFKTQQYNQFLEFINKHRFITQDDYDTDVYDAMAQYDDKSDTIRTTPLPDPTLLPYHKWLNERHTISSVGCRTHTEKVNDSRRIKSDSGFRSYHRTAAPLPDGRTLQSPLSWQMHVDTNVESPVRRLASAKCYHIEQKSQNPTGFDPVDHSLSYLRHRPVSSSISSDVTIRQRTPMHQSS